jgi:hypothetical protein
MPNWCDNRVYIEAPSEEISAILEAADNNSLLQYLCPAEPNDAIKAWGTSREVHAVGFSYSVEEGWINLAFESAWSPPINAFKHWASKNPNHIFNIRYVEWGMMFCGEASNIVDVRFYIPKTAEEVEKHIPSDIEEEFEIADRLAQWEE